MIRLTDLAGNGSFTMGGKKFEYGKVYSNPYVNAFKPVNEAEGSEDHEVSMAQNQLDSIIKAATELKQKMGEEEKQIPAWIQDHITNSENYISQAASNYHEYGDSNEAVISEETPIYKDWDEFVRPDHIIVHLKNGKKLKIAKNKMGGKFVYYTILKAFNDNNYKVTNKIVGAMLDKLGESVNEAPAKTPAERIQNLNNRIKALRDKMGATKSPIQKNLIQQRLKNALQSLSNIKKDHGIKAPHREGVNEVGVNDSNYNRILRMYDSGGTFTRKKIGVAVMKNPNASKSKILDALRDMDYEEITGVLHDLGIKESVNEDVKFRDGKYEFSSKGGFATLKYNGKELSSGDFDRGADAYFMNHSSWKGQKAFNDGKEVIAHFKKNRIVNEAGPCWKGYKQVGMKNKGGKQVPNCVPEGKMNEARGVTGIQNDISKVLNAIQSELEKYKANKGTDKAKQNVENLKKLNIQKQKLEAELDTKVSSMYADYDLDQLSSFKKKR